MGYDEVNQPTGAGKIWSPNFITGWGVYLKDKPRENPGYGADQRGNLVRSVEVLIKQYTLRPISPKSHFQLSNLSIQGNFWGAGGIIDGIAMSPPVHSSFSALFNFLLIALPLLISPLL